MKYLTLYETFLEEGDYIIFDHDIYSSKTTEVIIQCEKPYKVIKVYFDGDFQIICDDGKISMVNNKSCIYKKITKKEAKVKLNALKYNL